MNAYDKELADEIRTETGIGTHVSDHLLLRMTRGSFLCSRMEHRLAVRALWKQVSKFLPTTGWDWAWIGLVGFTAWAWWVTLGYAL